jgi:hypothetical protein
VGTPFSFVSPLGPGMSIIGDADQSLAFQLTAADLSGLSGETQVTAVGSSGALDLLLPSGLPGTRKDFDTIGGTLELGGIRDVSVALFYNVDSRSSGGELLWHLAGFADDGTFTFELPNGTNGTTIAYQIRITAPAAVMGTPVIIDDITLGYGVYTKPKPAHKPSHKPSAKPSSGTSGGTAPAGNDGAQIGAQTGNGSGTGAGNGSGAGNVSGGSVAHTRPTSPSNHGPSVSRRATATANAALPQSSSAGSSDLVSGYVLSGITAAQIPAVSGSSALPGSAVLRSGGHSQGGGSAAPERLGVFALAAVALLAIVAPWPLASRRLHALVGFDHDRQAVSAQAQDWLELPPDPASTARAEGRPGASPRSQTRRGSR